MGAVGEHVWIDVIQKMDEVYNDLLQYEVALEEKNRSLSVVGDGEGGSSRLEQGAHIPRSAVVVGLH